MDANPLRPDRAIGGPGKSAGPGSNPQVDKKSAESSSPAFRALLEKLEMRAKELDAKSREELDADGLSGAVGEARASLEDALSIGDQILEAYREARHRDAFERGGDDQEG